MYITPASQTYGSFLVTLAKSSDKLFVWFRAEHDAKRLVALGFGNLLDVFLLINLLSTGDGGEILV